MAVASRAWASASCSSARAASTCSDADNASGFEGSNRRGGGVELAARLNRVDARQEVSLLDLDAFGDRQLDDSAHDTGADVSVALGEKLTGGGDEGPKGLTPLGISDLDGRAAISSRADQTPSDDQEQDDPDQDEDAPRLHFCGGRERGVHEGVEKSA